MKENIISDIVFKKFISIVYELTSTWGLRSLSH